MVALPAAGQLSYDPANNHNSDIGPRFEAWLAFTAAMLGGSDEATYTISGGSITPTRAAVVVDTPGGAANLDFIVTTGLPLGWVILLRCASSSRPVTVRNGRSTGAQVLTGDGSDRVLTTPTMLVVLQRQSAGWREVLFYPGAGQSTWQSFVGIPWAQGVTGLATQAQATAGADARELMTALSTRQALTDKGWAAALSVFTGTYDASKWLVGTDGTNIYRVPSSVAIDGAPHKYYTRVDAAAAGSFSEANHGLGALPRQYFVRLRCNTADQGYAPGQEVESGDLQSYASGTVVGWTSGSSIGVGFGDGTFRTIVDSRWSIVVKAWL